MDVQTETICYPRCPVVAAVSTLAANKASVEWSAMLATLCVCVWFCLHCNYLSYHHKSRQTVHGPELTWRSVKVNRLCIVAVCACWYDCSVFLHIVTLVQCLRNLQTDRAETLFWYGKVALVPCDDIFSGIGCCVSLFYFCERQPCRSLSPTVSFVISSQQASPLWPGK